MNYKLDEYKDYIIKQIKLLGYTELRYSIFEEENINKQEYQIRIESQNSYYEVYVTGDRASIVGKHKFENIFDAITKFLNIMQSVVLRNRNLKIDGKNPEYPCPLWDNYIYS